MPYIKGYEPLTEEQKQYIIKNHLHMTVLEMCRDQKINEAKIYTFMKLKELPTLARKSNVHRKDVDRIPAGCFNYNEVKGSEYTWIF